MRKTTRALRTRIYRLRPGRFWARFDDRGFAWQETTEMQASCSCSDPKFPDIFPMKKDAEVVAAGRYDLELDGIPEPGYYPPSVIRYREEGFCRGCAPGSVRT